jgi:hypothetical protein
MISNTISIIESNGISLSPDKKSFKFSDLLSKIYSECEFFDSEQERFDWRKLCQNPELF